MALRENRNRVFLPPLEPGKYRITIKSLNFHEHPTDPEKDYYSIVLQFPDRTATDNRFEQGWNILLSHLRRQTQNKETYPTAEAFIQHYIDNQIELDCWYTVEPDSTGRLRQRYNFLEPLSKPENSTQEATPEDELPV